MTKIIGLDKKSEGYAKNLNREYFFKLLNNATTTLEPINYTPRQEGYGLYLNTYELNNPKLIIHIVSEETWETLDSVDETNDIIYFIEKI